MVLILLFIPVSIKEISGGNGQVVHQDMAKSIVNQNDETVWYENDRLIQQYLNHSRKSKAKKEDGSVSIPRNGKGVLDDE